jgi:hypothetical protein
MDLHTINIEVILEIIMYEIKQGVRKKERSDKYCLSIGKKEFLKETEVGQLEKPLAVKTQVYRFSRIGKWPQTFVFCVSPCHSNFSF